MRSSIVGSLTAAASWKKRSNPAASWNHAKTQDAERSGAEAERIKIGVHKIGRMRCTLSPVSQSITHEVRFNISTQLKRSRIRSSIKWKRNPPLLQSLTCNGVRTNNRDT